MKLTNEMIIRLENRLKEYKPKTFKETFFELYAKEIPKDKYGEYCLIFPEKHRTVVEGIFEEFGFDYCEDVVISEYAEEIYAYRIYELGFRKGRFWM